jgi:hypothetical protein
MAGRSGQGGGADDTDRAGEEVASSWHALLYVLSDPHILRLIVRRK